MRGISIAPAPATGRIYKFPLRITDEQTVRMPDRPHVLTAQFQGSDLVVWAVVNPDAPKVERTFRIYGTGNPLPADPGIYIATVQEPLHPLVWHVFWS